MMSDQRGSHENMSQMEMNHIKKRELEHEPYTENELLVYLSITHLPPRCVTPLPGISVPWLSSF